MIVGFTLGIFRMAVDTPVTLGWNGYEDAAQTIAKGYPYGSFFWIVNNINFQYFSILITIASAITMVAVSYMTKQPDMKAIAGLTFGTASDKESEHTRESWNWKDVAASAIVCFCILSAYLYFRG